MTDALRNMISLKEAARLLPGNVHPLTLWRWTLRGVGRVKLRHVRIGGRIFVSRDALNDFICDVTAQGPIKGRPTIIGPIVGLIREARRA